MNLNPNLALVDIKKCKTIMENNFFDKSTDFINVLCDEARVWTKCRKFDYAMKCLTDANELLGNFTDEDRCLSTQSYVDKCWAEYYEDKAVAKLEKEVVYNDDDNEPFYTISKELWKKFSEIYKQENKNKDATVKAMTVYINSEVIKVHNKNCEKIQRKAFDRRENIKKTFDDMRKHAQLSIESKIKRYGYLHNVLSYNVKVTAYQHRKIAAFYYCVYTYNQGVCVNKDKYLTDCIEYLFESQRRYDLHDCINGHYKVFQDNPDQDLHRPPDTSYYIPKAKTDTSEDELQALTTV
jgi:dynactin complex subunit